MSNKPQLSALGPEVRSRIRVSTAARSLVCLLAAGAMAAMILLLPFLHWNQQKEFAALARSTVHEAVSLSPRQALDGLAAYYKLNDRRGRPATLQLSLDKKDLETLVAKRNDALAQGWIASRHKRQLPAVLSVDDRQMNASVRLRGNQLDHLSGKKWSLKVNLKQGARFNGVRRFSLQAPYTRSFQSEAIISDAMRSVGVLAPRIDYVDLVLNGDRIGVMQMTEEFDTPLLESQGRRFGPLLQLDDAHTWKMVKAIERLAQDGSKNDTKRLNKGAWWNLYSGWRSAEPKAYGKYKKKKKREDLNTALSRWMAFAESQASPSEIFDIDAFVDFYIVCEYFAAHNLTQWLNVRLHYNTLTARFEPIAYDADLDYRPMHRAPLTCLNPRNELARTLMQDHAFASQWVSRIRELGNELASDQFASFVADRDKYYRRKLAADYPWLPAFDFSKGQRQCERLCGLTVGDFALPITGKKPLPDANSISLNELPPVVKVYVGKDDRGSFLTLRNRINADVVVGNLAFKNPVNEQLLPLMAHSEPGQSEPGQSEAGQLKEGNGAAQLPVYLRSIQRGVTDNRIALADATLSDHNQLSLQVDVVGLGTQQMAVKPLPMPKPAVIPQSISVELLLQRYPFISVDESGSVLQIETGQWLIDDLIILPRDTALEVNSGTQLLFAANAGLVLNGDLTVNGTAQAPVFFDAYDESSGWAGIFSHGVDSQVLIKHTTVNATRGFEIPGWRQPAGLLFHRATVALENVVVSSSCADDAINLVRSTVTIQTIQISNSCSDALDIDASTGTLSGLNLYQSGGDLLDISDSTVSLTSSDFSGAGDKAISVGEASDVDIVEIRISESTIGLAVKDFSDVKINKAGFTSLEIGLMAFQKKAEYGPAFIVGSELEIEAVRKYVLEKGSGIALAGEKLPVTPFDLSDFY